MPKSSVNASLSSYDDIFSTEESRQEEQREQVQQIPIGELFPFKNHPFKVLDDEAMQRTVESVAQYGVLAPLLARPRPEGGYEIISGHRRQHAAELAGLETLPVIVRQMDDDAAIILMVDGNLQREHILPSERAFAYKMKLDAMADSLSMAISPENIKSSHDVFISLFGELKIHTSHGVLPESDLKSPKISRLLTFMLLSNKKALSSLEIVQEIWPEELEDKDEPGKKVKQLVYRLRQAFSIISDEQLILSTPSGYQFNPDLHITTDFQRFDELCIAAAKATSAINKVRLLEKAASLYQGKLLSAANGEHWLVHYANRYHLAFMSTVNELLKQLMDFHAYDLLHRDAALALTIAPENTKAYYWLIRSYQKQHMDEMAAGELAAAKQKLPEDEYQKLLNSLER